MDLCDIIVNHFYDEIIKAKDADSIRKHKIINRPQYTGTSICLELEDGTHIILDPTNEHVSTFITLSQYLTDWAEEMDHHVRLPEIVEKDAIDLLLTYAKAVGPLQQDDTYEAVDLYGINEPSNLREKDRAWFRSLLAQKGIINMDNVKILIDVYPTADYLGFDTFCTYAFLYLYMIACTMSCDERETHFGHQFFLLPV
jgi:hypothetical protein